MLQITPEFKAIVVTALMQQRKNFTGTDAAFAKQFNINTAVFSRIKNGDTDKVLKDAQWMNIARNLDVPLGEKKFKVVETDVYAVIAEDIEFCQAYSKAMIFVDDSEIGKTVAAKHLSKRLTNCFYIDCSQSKTKQLFVRELAKCIGLDSTGKYADVKALIKYALKALPNPMMIIDEAGDLEYKAFLELKEFWNATEGACGWYMIGADGLKRAIEKGIEQKKVGYREIFSRFSSNYSSATPTLEPEKTLFYKKLIEDVLLENIDDKSKINLIVNKCLKKVQGGHIGGLRRAESLMILNS